MKIVAILTLLTPPLFICLVKWLRSKLAKHHYGLSGDYHSWAEATAASTGYDSGIILAKTRDALLKIKNGKAVYERDSVLFNEIEYSWPLLAGLMWVAARAGGKLNVLDIGGSLGTSYFQNRMFLSSVPQVRWNIVDQPAHIETGKKHFEDECLHFYTSIEECISNTEPNVVHLGSVIQYLEKPYSILEQLQKIKCDCLIIDRTPFWDGSTDRICVQTVPPSIYPASYPSWVFSQQRFRECFGREWSIVATFNTPDKLAGPVKVIHQGLIVVRNG